MLLYKKILNYLIQSWPKYFKKKVIFFQKNNFFLYLIIKKKWLKNILYLLKNNSLCRLTNLIDIISYDLLYIKNRFIIIYLLNSFLFNNQILLFLKNSSKILNIISIWNIFFNANWFEREIWDLFGIFFFNHPNLQKLLTDYGFKGYPLRKDFPLIGFNDLFYKDFFKRLKYTPIEMSQEYRKFNFLSPW
jgi:NADH:ubiquinone oxidoreductase subunit C